MSVDGTGPTFATLMEFVGSSVAKLTCLPEPKRRKS
jgi:hypothetical protein